jgi:sulfur relay (sulfurtransferase) DsrC/TusE family protein
LRIATNAQRFGLSLKEKTWNVIKYPQRFYKKKVTSKRDMKEINFVIQGVLRSMDITEADDFVGVSEM